MKLGRIALVASLIAADAGAQAPLPKVGVEPIVIEDGFPAMLAGSFAATLRKELAKTGKFEVLTSEAREKLPDIFKAPGPEPCQVITCLSLKGRLWAVDKVVGGRLIGREESLFLETWVFDMKKQKIEKSFAEDLPRSQPNSVGKIFADIAGKMAAWQAAPPVTALDLPKGPVPVPGGYLVIDLSAGITARSFPVKTLEAAPADLLSNPAYKTTKLVLRRLPKGSFIMGAPEYEWKAVGGVMDETQHRVTLTQDFYISIFKVTQAQWGAVMSKNPSEFKGATLPVEGTDCWVVRGKGPFRDKPRDPSFLARLSARCGRAFDMPTEAQWEYACRAGTRTSYLDGTDAPQDLLKRIPQPRPQLLELGWGIEPTGWKTHEVALKKPNAWGLYDMLGNDDEWCLDQVSDYDLKEEKDPVNTDLWESQIVRGDKDVGEYNSRSANRKSRVAAGAIATYPSFRVVSLAD